MFGRLGRFADVLTELQFAFKIVLPQRTYVLVRLMSLSFSLLSLLWLVSNGIQQADTEQDRSMWLYCLRLAMQAQ